MKISTLVTNVITEYGNKAEKDKGHAIVDLMVKLAGGDKNVPDSIADRVMQAGVALRKLGVK